MAGARSRSKTSQQDRTAIDGVVRAHRQAIGEGGGLGAAREGHRRRKASSHRLDRLESGAAPESLVEVES